MTLVVPRLTKEEVRAQVASMLQEELDELVHEYKADEASTLNNSGREEQIAYVMQFRGW